MSRTARGSVAWLALILTGLALGAYVVVAWPDTSPRLVRLPYGEAMPKTPAVKLQTVRSTSSAASSADADPEAELASVLGDAYPLELFFYELNPAPLLDIFISAPQRVDAR